MTLEDTLIETNVIASIKHIRPTSVKLASHSQRREKQKKIRALDTISTLTFTSRAHYSFIWSFGQEFLVQSNPTTLYVPIFLSLLFFLFHRDWHAMLFVVFRVMLRSIAE